MRMPPFLVICCLLALCPVLLAKPVALNDDAIRMVGRFTEDFRFGWTGSMIETEFSGTSIAADLEVVDGDAAGLTIVVDGASRFLKLTKGRQLYTLADGLAPALSHSIEIFKRSEGGKGEVEFHGFEISDDGRVVLPEAPQRKILVIGDSITCGYGNEAKTLDEGNSVENQNGYLSYAPFAGPADKGGHYHPSVKKHKSMAAELVAEIERLAEW
ncbi:Unannotated [Lentimonas sp. CC4]|nr:Unannotated [Lentimonas sp. CC4]CAA6683660.1 Unannotated [Lentimonas sp. CC6]CAA7074493.1 Unannotated [Lentimonas sp. CC4]CAA7169105.1 Unannotated [Lentimonas sp. CC21]CAA7180489.1 Unannotated [Lentimonas sp. CC8]